MIREITAADLDGLMTLYMQLHDNPFPEKDERFMSVWQSVLDDPNHHIIVAEEDYVSLARSSVPCLNDQ